MKLAALAFLIATPALACETPKPIRTIQCSNPGVVDGDTLRCDGQRIRLWGVNAVERGQPGYAQASNALAKITRKPITCRAFYTDRYHRPVAQCFNRNGDLGWQLISAGSVVDMPRYSRGFYGAACMEGAGR